ncbi:thioredoxin domain-containing protein [Clostridium aminobutyricum]|uniref:Thioredoxin domain-containing protein n=1 Tax=Clostridium aminobutyricum TaxID=33953 RepID=A0A939IGL8_CLOAM|nr:thioredoxin domain-containing protein [Clostridium aminobutyricum]MBN7773515.1 thioredoxin domain-containing protein [Clostridium aminobutyricum]
MPNNIKSNQLINEKSPYLLQHAHNPVNWYPWGEEAFKKAKSEEKPIFLSIGYSTCHWCHVMAHESFEDHEVAEVLNNNFVCIKVDREERPDVDSVYMTVCQALTGSGGWPLTIVMTPEQKPFWAGTYLPKRSQYGHVGLLELLDAIIQQWEVNRKRLIESGDEIITALEKHRESRKDRVEPTKELIDNGVTLFRHVYDKQWGGFGPAPKFPTPHNLLFLLRYAFLEKNQAVQGIVTHTLDQMFKGGMFDHIGGGFSRYSTDEKWLVPHFEKMLYDNALLAYVYAEAYQFTGKSLYREVAKRTLDYVLRELTDEEGGFYCGQDADSEGVEGKYYVFTPEEIKQVVGDTDGELFCKWYAVTERGNFEGKSIPNLIENPNYEGKIEDIEQISRKLYEYRLHRTVLHKDDKVLTSWNALMIAALAKASILLEDPVYLEAAQQAQTFIAKNLTDEEGRLYIRWREGQTAHTGQLDDYAFYAFALIELYKNTFCVDYLQEAIRAAEQIMSLFFDEGEGGCYLYAADSEQLISRPKEVYDGALPSGNSIATLVFDDLAKYTGEIKWKEARDKQLEFISGEVKANPLGHSVSMIALMGVFYPSQELVCVQSQAEVPSEWTNSLKTYRPNLTVLVKNAENRDKLEKLAPFTASYPIPQQGSQYYLCENGSCLSPVSTLEELEIEKF